MPMLPKRVAIAKSESRGPQQRPFKRKKHDPAIHRLYCSTRWQNLRRDILGNSPLCVLCDRKGRIEPANIVDHITPHKGDLALFFDRNNLQSLCKQCHDRKTAAEDGGFGNAIRS